jgi:hypothetical protein
MRSAAWIIGVVLAVSLALLALLIVLTLLAGPSPIYTAW